jgi:uncharacterized Fe-S center protein
MNSSNVYFTNMRVKPGDSLQKKLTRLITAAGMGKIHFEDQFAAIKMHFGELGNLAFLRHQYAKTIVDFVKSQGGKPFLTDANTLYVGGRKNALEHLDTAYLNGFSPLQTGCQILIADGLKGTDEVLVPVEGGEYVKEAKVARALMDADIIISLTHFKVHEATGIGGTLKNIGMGGGSRAGKMEMHSAGKPLTDSEKCIGCGQCTKVCAHHAITVTNKKAAIDHEKCVGCGRCIGVCPKDAICAANDEVEEILNKKIVEYSWAILHNRPQFHISLVVSVSPYCDCHEENDTPVVPDVGMFASFDPIALDQACADAVNQQIILPGSELDGKAKQGDDYFTALFPNCSWRTQIAHGEKMGLGTKEYQLITVK